MLKTLNHHEYNSLGKLIASYALKHPNNYDDMHFVSDLYDIDRALGQLSEDIASSALIWHFITSYLYMRTQLLHFSTKCVL